MDSKNPILKDDRLTDGIGEGKMTVAGTLNKTTLSLLMMFASASYVWFRWFEGDHVLPLMIAGAIGALVLVLFTVFVPTAAPVTVPLYAICEGFFLGGISAHYSSMYNGIVTQAVLVTISVMLAMLLLYRFRVLRASPGFRKGVVMATLSVFILYLIDIALRFFGMSVPFLHESSLIGVGLSLVIIIIAALNFILDFDMIERGVKYEAPKKMEWIGAMGLLTTLVWLYLEVLRLLSLLQSND